MFLQLSNEITYSLLVGKGREAIRTCFCSYPMRSRTLCGWEKVDRQWGQVSAAIRWDHILPVGGKRWRDGEDEFLQPSNEITYSLCVGKGGEAVRASFCSYPMRSRTICGGQRPRGGKDMFLHLSDEITYSLWVGKGGEMVRTSFYSYPMRSHTCCGGKRQKDGEKVWAKSERWWGCVSAVIR